MQLPSVLRPSNIIPHLPSANYSTPQRRIPPRSTHTFGSSASLEALAIVATKNWVSPSFHASVPLPALIFNDIQPRDLKFIDFDGAICEFTLNEIRSSRVTRGLRAAFDGGTFSTNSR